MNKILYITYDGLTDPLGQSQILPYIIGVCKINPNLQFHIISFEKKQRFLKDKSIIKKSIQNYNIHWYPLSYTKHPPVLSTVFDLFRLFNIAKKLYKKNKFDIIHCRSYISAMVGLYFKKRYGVKFIFDMRGFWADERVDGGLWNLKNPLYGIIYKYFKQKEVQYLNNADSVISLTYKAKDEMLTWNLYNLNGNKIQVIPCAADYQHFDPKKYSESDKIAIRKELDIKNSSFVLTYLGSLRTWYLLDEMLDFFGLLVKRQPDSIFLLITPEKETFIKQRAVNKNIPINKLRIIFTSRNNVPKYLSISNVGIFFIKNAYSKMSSSPVKLGEFLSMDIPVIINDIGDNALILKDMKSCYLLDNLTHEKFINIINNMNFYAENLREISRNYFSLEKGVEKYNQIYKNLL